MYPDICPAVVFAVLVALVMRTSADCPPFYPDPSLTVCYPEVGPGQPVSEGTNCITTCRQNTTMSHCSGGQWQGADPSTMLCLSGCPLLSGVAPGSSLTCYPPIGNADFVPDGTFCIFSCYGHTVDGLTCSKGEWDSDPNHLSCSNSTSPSSTTGASTTKTSTTSAPLPQLQVELAWSFFYLGQGIGEAGLIHGDFNTDNSLDIFIGSYSSSSWQQRTTTLSILEHQRPNLPTYRVVWQEESEARVATIVSLSRGLGAMYALVGQEKGLLTIYDLTERVKVASVVVFDASLAIFKIFHADLDRDGFREVMLFGRADNQSPAQLVVYQLSFGIDGSTSLTERFRSTQPLATGDVAFGAFSTTTENARADFVFGSGEIFHLDVVRWSLEQVASFNTNLGHILQALDVDGDGRDEVFAAQNIGSHSLASYSARSLSRLWSLEVKELVRRMEVVNADGCCTTISSYPFLLYNQGWPSAVVAASDVRTGTPIWNMSTGWSDSDVMALSMRDLDNDNIADVTFSLGYDNTGADNFFVQDTRSGSVRWKSDDLGGPFNGYAVYEYVNGSGGHMLALVSSDSDSGYGGAQVFGLNFADKSEVWRADLQSSWSGVSDLIVGDTNGDSLTEIITLGSWTYDGRIHIIDGRTGNIKSVFSLATTPRCGFLLDLDEDGSIEIVVGDQVGDIHVLDAGTGVVELTVAQVGWGGTALRHLLPLIVQPGGTAAGLLAVTAGGQLMYYRLGPGTLTSITNSTMTVTSLSVAQGRQQIFIGDADGRVHMMDASTFAILTTVTVCPGEEVASLDMFRTEDVLTYSCSTRFGALLSSSMGSVMTKAVDRPVGRVKMYEMGAEIYFLIGGDLVQLYSAHL